ncbi:hypothetical protein [Pedobacter sandarakinus]|uniref:hypothetical protein n=1 Tax=Pedobacter sandarakinus TaxID=353156 RepID=UPI002246CEDF|nr:hypothetical protein [Pedobacter sandarakinus]MCX2576360.1 hypothetical protein [Pedobacter sandarakinus]
MKPTTFSLAASNSVDLYSTVDNGKTVYKMFDTLEQLLVDPVRKDTIIESVARERMIKRFGSINYNNFIFTGNTVTIRKEIK